MSNQHAGSSKGNVKSSDDLDMEESFDKGAVAGPSSPSRRRRRPSTTRRRSSTISAATSLISSYSKSPPGRANGSGAPNDGNDDSNDGRRPGYVRAGTSDAAFAGGATETFYDARQALERGVPSPYHMALVTLLGSLAQGMPLASMFKVYSYTMCRVYQERQKGDGIDSLMLLPPAPELPSDPICSDPWVQEATSTYAAAMATVGALLGLVLLERCSRISRRFGRKPLMLFSHIFVALAFVFFRISILLPTYIAAVVLYIAVMVLEASGGAPLRIAVQNYIVDTTTEAQRAGALSFIDGFGQLGAFPSATLGGLLAAATQTFFAPFYASISIYIFAVGYILVFVPESKKNRHHTLIDNWEHGIEDTRKDDPATKSNGQPSSVDGEEEDGGEPGREELDRRVSYISTAASEQSMQTNRSTIRRILRRLNFLAPLSVFLPKKIEGTKRRDWRLLNLATVVLFEESFQVFLVPTLLLYNTEVFQYDVVQNGYLVSLLQGTRALFLTAIFPPAVSKAREWIKKRHQKKRAQQEEEREPLLSSNNRNINNKKQSKPPSHTVEARDMAEEERQSSGGMAEEEQIAKEEDRGKLDIAIMLASYVMCMASFILLGTSRIQQEKDKKGKIPAWVLIGAAIVGLELGSGATSVRTALIVNAVGEDEEQSKALAANQILCTGIYAIVPLVTSSIFGLGLSLGKPEIVWTFKAVMAALACISTLFLFFSYQSPHRHT
jgi:MFS family permease